MGVIMFTRARLCGSNVAPARMAHQKRRLAVRREQDMGILNNKRANNR